MQDVAAERGVIGAVCRFGGEAYLDVSDLIGRSAFTVEANKVIWSCLERACQTDQQVKFDLPTVLSAANALGLSSFFDKKEEMEHLRAVFNVPVRQESVRRLAAKLAKLEIARNLHGKHEEAKQALEGVTGDESPSEILALAENPILEETTRLASSGSEGPVNLWEGIDEYLDYLETNPCQQIGYSSGFPIWDAAIGGGLRPGTVNVIGARRKCGKTVIAENIALHFTVRLQLPILMLDTEMGKRDHHHRALACLSSVPISDIETGRYGADAVKRQRVRRAAQLNKGTSYTYRSIHGQPFEETLGEMRRWVVKKVGGAGKPCLIVFDYLKLMTAKSLTKNLAEYQVIGFMMTELHDFAVRWQVPLLVLVQLNRENEVSQSDRITWLCSNYSQLEEQTEEEMAQQPPGVRYNRKLVVSDAVRHGPGLEEQDFINVRFDRPIARMTEGPTHFQQQQLNPNRGEIADEPGPLQF